MYQVYCYGMISASTVHILNSKSSYPLPNEYGEIEYTLPSIGGEAVNTAIILSKLGIKTKLDGTWIGEKNIHQILTLLKPFDIDITRLSIKPHYQGPEEVLIIDKLTRTVFGNYQHFFAKGKQWNTPKEIDIQNIKMVSIDPFFREDSLILAQFCVKNQKPYVTIDCTYDSFLAQNAEAVIISHEIRNQEYKNIEISNLFEEYQKRCKGLVIFTFGEKDLWYSHGMTPVRTFSPFSITPVDTTGAGDSFRAGIIYGLLNRWDDEATIKFACAVAACVCLSVPHTLNAPKLDEILQFMLKNNKK